VASSFVATAQSGRAHAVSAFTGAAKLGLAVFSNPFKLPIGVVVNRLTFTRPPTPADFDAAGPETMIETEPFGRLWVVVVLEFGSGDNSATTGADAENGSNDELLRSKEGGGVRLKQEL